MSAKNRLPDLPLEDSRKLAYRIDETYWGYIIRERKRDDLRVDVFQAVAGLFGLGFVSAAVAVWAVPGSIVEGDVALFKAVVSAMSCAFGVFLLWYAAAGQAFELQVDLSRRELREATRNKKGQARFGRRHRFADVAKVLVHSDPGDTIDAALMIKFCDSDTLVEVVTAPEHQLYALRNRLARDVSQGNMQRRDARFDAFLKGQNPATLAEESMGGALRA